MRTELLTLAQDMFGELPEITETLEDMYESHNVEFFDDFLDKVSFIEHLLMEIIVFLNNDENMNTEELKSIEYDLHLYAFFLDFTNKTLNYLIEVEDQLKTKKKK